MRPTPLIKRIRDDQKRLSCPNTPEDRSLSGRPLRKQSSSAYFYAVALCASIYCLIFSYISLSQYDRFGSSTFDLAIFDQAMWLIVHGKAPFVTLRGVHILADHFSIVLYLIAPLYALLPSPKTLLVLQTIALAAGSLPLFAIARRILSDPRFALGVSVSYLCCPLVHMNNVSEFHPDAFGIPLILSAYAFVLSKKWAPYCISMLCIMLVKETAVIVALVMAVLIWPVSRKMSAITVLIGAISAVVALLAVSRFNHGVGTSYAILYHSSDPAEHYDTPSRAWSFLVHVLRDPLRSAFVWDLFAPLAFLPLLTIRCLPVIFFFIVPAIISPLASMHFASSHRIAFTVPFLYLCACYGIRKVHGNGNERSMAGLLAIFTLYTLSYSILHSIKSPFWMTEDPGAAAYTREIAQALDRIPQSASLSGTASLMDHLSHRVEAYCFPNPFYPVAWGNSRVGILNQYGKSLPAVQDDAINARLDGQEIDYIVLLHGRTQFPVADEQKYMKIVQLTTQSLRYGIVECTPSIIVLRRGADHRRGLESLSVLVRGWVATELDDGRNSSQAVNSWMSH